MSISLNPYVSILISLQIALLPNISRAQDLRQVLDLRGRWKFELGDDSAWANRDFDDSRWDVIQAPSPWADQGYPGYDGYAWYRKHFRGDDLFGDRPLYLRLGHIDDAGEVFLNGHMIGFVGSFPPNFASSPCSDATWSRVAWTSGGRTDSVSTWHFISSSR